MQSQHLPIFNLKQTPERPATRKHTGITHGRSNTSNRAQKHTGNRHGFIDRRGKRNFEEVRMPNTRTGVVMVFKTFDEVSYALVMESTLPVRVNDVVAGI